MAEFSARRVVVVAAIAGAIVGGAVAVGVSEAATSGNNRASSPGNTSSISTAAVVRTTLTTAVQVGGSISYGGSYAIAAPAGASAQQIAQAQQAVTLDQQTLSSDQQTETDASSSDSQTIASDLESTGTARSMLSSDRAKRAKDCVGKGASGPTCRQVAQQVGQDEGLLTQAEHQLGGAESTATMDHDQNQARVTSDETRLQGDKSILASLEPTEVNPGTTYTWLPQVGTLIKQDHTLYSISNVPVPLLYGSIPAYRAFYLGVSDGADVGELTHDLIVLGYGAGLAQSDHYSSSTATAVERWEKALGLPATGEIPLGEVAFEPGPMRVTSVNPSVGESLGGGVGGSGNGGVGTVLTATGTTPIVTVELDVTQEYLVKPGDGVSIVLPDGTSIVGGHIEMVGNVATCPGGGGIGAGAGAGSSPADQSPCESSGSGNSSTPTVTVTITLDNVPPDATLDQAPVNVNITSQRVTNVLAVPVNSLLALAGGGLGVDVVTGNTSHLVGVTTGLYSNTLVQVSGSGISAGTEVEVPSS